MDWHDFYTWWMGKYRLDGTIAYLDFFAAFEAWSAGDDVWQAAFDGVLDGMDEELIAIVGDWRTWLEAGQTPPPF